MIPLRSVLANVAGVTCTLKCCSCDLCAEVVVNSVHVCTMCEVLRGWAIKSRRAVRTPKPLVFEARGV